MNTLGSVIFTGLLIILAVNIAGGLLTFFYLVIKGVPRDPKWYNHDIEEKFWGTKSLETIVLEKKKRKTIFAKSAYALKSFFRPAFM